MNGILLINKSMGMTSFAAVAKCRRTFHEKKTGHSGTLDPNATGLLLVFLGKYTKYIPYCVKDHKHYKATFELGKKTDTQDIWGTIIATKEPSVYSDEVLTQKAHCFIGEIEQVPPMYSALKKDGKKLYEYAREGIEVERKARRVRVNQCIVTHLHDNVYAMDAIVSSGTYIRTLIEDFAASLGEYGTMTSLVRVGIESLSLEEAVDIDSLDETAVFIDPKRVLDPAWKLIETDQVADIKNGKKIKVDGLMEPQVIFTHQDEILAAYQYEKDGLYHCVRGLF